MKRPLLIVVAGIVFIVGLVTAVYPARTTTGAKKTTAIETTNPNKKTVLPPDSNVIRPFTVRITSVSPQVTVPAMRAGSSPNYQLNWLSMNSGGGPTASASYQTNTTVGQAMSGKAASTHYAVAIGYWYGASGGGCDCPYQCDFDADGFPTALDLAAMIDILFAGQPNTQDPDCPSPRADFDCDGFPTAIDLAGYIDYLFAGAHGPCDPCAP